MLAKFQKSAYRLLMKVSAGWGEEIVLLMKVSAGWDCGHSIAYGYFCRLECGNFVTLVISVRYGYEK